MTPAETLAVYVALIGIPVFFAVLGYTVCATAKYGDKNARQAGRDRQVRGAGSVSLGEPTELNNARGRAAADSATGPPACKPVRTHAILVGRMPNRGARR